MSNKKAGKKIIGIVLVQLVCLLTSIPILAFLIPLETEAEQVIDLSQHFRVSDEEQTWTTETSVDIFHCEYSNGTLTTVKSGTDEKVVAPGTSGEYRFRLKNSDAQGLSYSMSFQSAFPYEDYSPVQVKLLVNQQWILGSDQKYENLDALDQLQTEGTLPEQSDCECVLYWMWEFDGNEEEDTVLGNLSETGKVTCRLAINVQATWEGTAAEEQETPDWLRYVLPAAGATGSLAGLLLLLIFLLDRYTVEFIGVFEGAVLRKKKGSIENGFTKFVRVRFGHCTVRIQGLSITLRVKRTMKKHVVRVRTLGTPVIWLGRGVRNIRVPLRMENGALTADLNALVGLDRKGKLVNVEKAEQ